MVNLPMFHAATSGTRKIWHGQLERRNGGNHGAKWGSRRRGGCRAGMLLLLAQQHGCVAEAQRRNVRVH